jgi:hypothetical protein
MIRGYASMPNVKEVSAKTTSKTNASIATPKTTILL